MTARAERRAADGEARVERLRAVPHPPVPLDEDAQARLRAAQAALGIVPEPPASHSLDEDARQVLSRLDASRATPQQVRDALGVVGIHVSLDLAAEWLAECRAVRRSP